MHPKPRLTHPATGADLGEIAEVSYEDCYDGIDFYYVWVKRPETEDPED